MPTKEQILEAISHRTNYSVLIAQVLRKKRAKLSPYLKEIRQVCFLSGNFPHFTLTFDYIEKRTSIKHEA
jgi:hypothetical protein